MPIVSLILVLLFVGFIIWLIQTVPIPINPWIKNVIVGLIFFGVLLWLLNVFGFHTGFYLR